MSRDDIVGIFGTAISSFLAYLGFLWSIGALQLVFSFLTGAFSTYLVQHRLQMESEKRKIRREDAIVMRDNVYGPIFREMSKILESVRSGYLDDFSRDLKKIMVDYLFFTIKQNLKDNLTELLDRVNKYRTIHLATEVLVQDVMRKEISKSWHIEIGNAPDGAVLRLLIGKVMTSAISLKETLFLNITPKDFMRKETEKWGKDVSVEVRAGGMLRNLNDFEFLHEHLIHEIEKEPLYIEEKKQRVRLVNELEAFLGKIKVFVIIE